MHQRGPLRTHGDDLPLDARTPRARQGRRALDGEGPLRGRAPGEGAGRLAALHGALLQGVRAQAAEGSRSRHSTARQAGLPRRRSPQDLRPRARRLPAGGGDREAHEGRDRRLRGGPREGGGVMADAYDKLIFELSSPGRVAWSLPEADVPEADARTLLPAKHLRRDAPDLPEVSEFDVVRHYSRLSRLNYGVDTHFYPLGSCTMKYNPKLNEDMARLAGFAKVHPLAPEALSQGALQLMHELARDQSGVHRDRRVRGRRGEVAAERRSRRGRAGAYPRPRRGRVHDHGAEHAGHV